MKEDQVSIFDSHSDSSMKSYRDSVEQIQEQLSSYGLTGNQSKVYIFLGKYGSKTAPEVCKALKLPRTETYHLLTSLQNKGIVSATFQHPIKFKALPLNKAVWTLVNAEKERVKTLEKQHEEISKIWETIPEFHDQPQEDVEEKFQMLEGLNQINTKITEMIDTADEKFVVLGSEKDYLRFYHADFLEPLNKSKLDVKLLSGCTDKTIYVFDDIDRNKVRVMKNIQDNLCLFIKDEDEVLFFMKNSSTSVNNPSAMWTNSPAMIYAMRLLFDNTWSKSKDIHL